MHDLTNSLRKANELKWHSRKRIKLHLSHACTHPIVIGRDRQCVHEKAAQRERDETRGGHVADEALQRLVRTEVRYDARGAKHGAGKETAVLAHAWDRRKRDREMHIAMQN